MSRISKENFGCFECSLRTDTLATFIISLVVSELPDYLVSHGYRKYPEYYQRLYDSIPEVVFIAWSSSVIGALCGAIKNQPLLLIPYVVVKLLDMVFSIIQTFAVESHQSVVAVDIRPFIVADSYIVWSFSIVGLYGVMREKPVLQIIYLVVESLNWVFFTLLIFVVPIILYNDNGLLSGFGVVYVYTIWIEFILGIFFSVSFVKFNVVLSYYKECRSKPPVLDTELSPLN